MLVSSKSNVYKQNNVQVKNIIANDTPPLTLPQLLNCIYKWVFNMFHNAMIFMFSVIFWWTMDAFYVNFYAYILPC